MYFDWDFKNLDKISDELETDFKKNDILALPRQDKLYKIRRLNNS